MLSNPIMRICRAFDLLLPSSSCANSSFYWSAATIPWCWMVGWQIRLCGCTWQYRLGGDLQDGSSFASVLTSSCPTQVHGRDTCVRSECPYAKKTGRARPNCVWDEHKRRCKSPEPSFFYMLTEEGGLYLTDPDDQTLKREFNLQLTLIVC